MGSVTTLFLVFRNVNSAQVILPGRTTDMSGCPVVSGVKSGLKDEVHRSELSLSALKKSWKVSESHLQWLEGETIEGVRRPALVQNCKFNIR